MPSSRIVDLAIGLAFMFAVTAALASVLTELIARFLGLRGATLLQGMRDLVDADGATTTRLGAVDDDYRALKDLVASNLSGGQASLPEGHSTTGALLGSPILSNQGMAGRLSARTALALGPPPADRAGPRAPATPGGPSPANVQGSILSADRDRLRRQTRSLPAYIPARSFAQAVVDLVVPDGQGLTTIAEVRSGVAALPDSSLKTSLTAILKTAGDDIDAFRDAVEHWYDDHMARVSGWYKRRTGKITLVVGALLVVLLNINSVTLARTLYSDGDVRTAIADVAGQSTRCPAGAQEQACLEALHQQLSDVVQLGIPIGWATVAPCGGPGVRCNWLDRRGIFDPDGGSLWRVVLLLVGFALTIVALVPGSRFWFDLLGRLGSLRSTGPRPSG